MDGLFRDEVVQAQRPQAWGSISLATPLSFVWWVLIAAALAAAIVLFLAFGHYTRRETVAGQLWPTGGLLTLSANTTGIVTQTLVHEGEPVQADQPLVEMSSDLVSASMGNTHDVVAAQLRAQENQTRTTLADIRPQTVARAKDLHARAHMLKAQIQQIDDQLALQRQEAASADQLLKNAAPLRKRGIVSTLQFDQYQDTVLSQQVQVKALVRQRLDAAQQLSTLKSKLTQLPYDTTTKANQLRGRLAQLEAQLAQNATQGGTVLRAPRAGIVSTLLVNAGQNVAAGQPILSILPKGSKLEAQLLVPSSAIGLVTRGSKVVLRYQAFPYERFGQQYGKVVQVSRSALSPAEAASLLGHSPGQNVATPLYRVLVALNRQSISAYGHSHRLTAGMALSADILLGRSSLLAWAFDPLRGLHQQLATTGEGHQG